MAARATHRDFWKQEAPNLVIAELSRAQREATYPGLDERHAIGELRTERSRFARSKDRRAVYEADARAAREHLRGTFFPSKFMAAAGKWGFYLSIALMLGSLFFSVAGGFISDSRGTSTDWLDPVLNFALFMILVPWLFAGLWAAGSALHDRAQRRRILNWAVAREGQLARGLVNFPRPSVSARRMITIPCHALFGLAIFMVLLSLWWAIDSPFMYATPEGWWAAILSVAFLSACFFFPRFQKRRLQKHELFALALIPSDNDAIAALRTLQEEEAA